MTEPDKTPPAASGAPKLAPSSDAPDAASEAEVAAEADAALDAEAPIDADAAAEADAALDAEPEADVEPAPLSKKARLAKERLEIAEEPGNHGRFAFGCAVAVTVALAAFFLVRLYFMG